MRNYRFKTALPDCGKMNGYCSIKINNTYFNTMKALSILFIAFLFFTAVYAQDTTKVIHPKPSVHQLLRNIIGGPRETDRFRRRQDSLVRPTLPPETHHPDVYIDGGFGYSFLGVHGMQSNYSVNYQAGDGMFTFKGVDIASYKPNDNPYDYRLFKDWNLLETNSLDQLDFMYGRRFVNRAGQNAFNISAGIGIESRGFFYYTYPNMVQTRSETSAAYVGVPFEANYQLFSRRFGVSFNIKLSGDISRYSFASIGVALGLGYHYKN
jgi:hypothetical protein